MRWPSENVQLGAGEFDVVLKMTIDILIFRWKLAVVFSPVYEKIKMLGLSLYLSM